jgi:hypothetical protein
MGFDQELYSSIYTTAPLTGITSFEKFVVYRNASSKDVSWFSSIQYYQMHLHFCTFTDNMTLPKINKNTEFDAVSSLCSHCY